MSHQRSGSHFLKGTLRSYNAHLERIAFDGQRYLDLPEIFLAGIVSKFPEFRDWLFEPFHSEFLRRDALKWGTPQGIADAASLFLDKLHDQATGRIVLADIKLNQLYIGEGWFHETSAMPRMIYKLAAKGKIIFLRRRNLIRSIVSGLQAEQTNVWHVEEEAISGPVNITVNLDDFMARLVHLDRGLAEAESWLGRYPDTVHSVHYEDLFDPTTLACNQPAFDAIAAFAGMSEGIQWRSPLRKIGLHRLEAIIENFDDLRERILPTKYAAMLSE